MSGIPLSYFTGLGAAMPAGRADPAACERLRNAKTQYDLWSRQPDSPASIAERAKYRKQWDALRAQRACRPAIAAPAPTQPAVADGPGRVQIPTQQPAAPAPRTLVNLPSYQTRPRAPRQSSLLPLATVFAPPYPQQSAMATIPAWAKVLGGVSVAVIVVTMISKALRRRG